MQQVGSYVDMLLLKKKTVQISCTFLTVVCAQLHWLQAGIDIDAEQLAGANSNVESLCQESARIIRYWESLGLTPARACLFDGTQAAMRFGCSSRPFWLLPVVPDWTDAGEGKPQRMDDWSLEPFFGVQRLDFRTFSLQAIAQCWRNAAAEMTHLAPLFKKNREKLLLYH